MIPNAQNLIQTAIRNKRRLLMHYAGKPRSRIVEPHLVYKSDNGIVVVLCYQIRGYHSSKRHGSFWRPFQLRKIDALRITDELFMPRIKEGFSAVRDLIRGPLIAEVSIVTDHYMHFEPAIHGPPTPAYFASSPSLMLRMVANQTPG